MTEMAGHELHVTLNPERLSDVVDLCNVLQETTDVQLDPGAVREALRKLSLADGAEHLTAIERRLTTVEEEFRHELPAADTDYSRGAYEAAHFIRTGRWPQEDA